VFCYDDILYTEPKTDLLTVKCAVNELTQLQDNSVMLQWNHMTTCLQNPCNLLYFNTIHFAQTEVILQFSKFVSYIQAMYSCLEQG